MIITYNTENKNYLIHLINFIIGMLLSNITRKNEHGRLMQCSHKYMVQWNDQYIWIINIYMNRTWKENYTYENTKQDKNGHIKSMYLYYNKQKW